MSLDHLTKQQLKDRVRTLEATLLHIQQTYGTVIEPESTVELLVEQEIQSSKSTDATQSYLSQENAIAVLDALPMRVYIKDEHRCFTYANQETLAALGASTLAEVIGKTDYDFYNQEEATRWAYDESAILAGNIQLT